MRINNNFNVLPFYDSLQKQNSKKWYSFGQHYPLICPNNTILPFQFITDSEVTVSSNIEAVNVHSGKVTNLGVKPSVSKGTQADATYYIVKMVETTISAMPEGLHYLRINTNKGYLYSEEFTFNANHEECIKIEYWNENTLNFNSGEINFDDDFRFILYIPSTIGKPEYEFEEELTKRLGYKFIESQTSNKIYKFNFLAPEYICDAMRLIRLCDYIKLTTKFDTFNALSFAYEPKWQDNGDLAAVDVEFDTDCIIQKLESFNRRLKESFYNALLADIDEPVLFSNDIVAQYYTEFTTTSYINGKLIRQLEAINEADLGSLENLVLPIDNQADTEQKAKKITLASLKNVLIKLADYVTLSTAQNINGEKNFIGGLKVNGSPIVYDAAKGYWKLQGNLVLTGGITMYADDGSVELPSLYDGLPIDGTTIYWETDEAGNRVLKAVGGGGTADSVAWNNITGKPSWIGSSKPTYTYSEIQNTPDLSLYAKKTDIPSLSGYATESWVKQQNYAIKATTLSGYGITDAYTKTNVDDLLKSYVTLGGTQTITGEKNFTGGLKVNGSPIYYDTEKKYWKLEGDLLVTGGITMYGNEGTYTPSTIMDAIAVDGTTISKSGGVLKVIGGTGGGVADSVAWSNITGKPNFASVATSGKYDDLIGKPTLLSSFTDDVVSGKYLPLSGGELKGVLTISTSAINPMIVSSSGMGYKSYIAYQNGTSSGNDMGSLGFSGKNVPSFRTNSIDGGKEYKLLHENNYSSYALPLLGGAMLGDIEFTIPSGKNTSLAIKFTAPNINYLYAKADELYFGLDGISTGKIWHSGNDGSGSGLDADLLDGYHAMDFTKTINSSVDDFLNFTYKARFQTAFLSGQGDFCSLVVPTWKGNSSSNWYLSEIRFELTGALKFRTSHSGSVTTNWREFAFTDSNVASATKLQTSRTIWGQSFDGTRNVSGALSDVTGITFKDDYYGLVIDAFGNFSFKKPYSTAAADWSFKDSSGNKLMIINNSGNVGIGTTSPQQKLDVIGKVKADALYLTRSNGTVAFTISEEKGTNGYNLIAGGGTSYIRFYTNYTSGAEERMRIDSYGNIGIGTNLPSYKLHVVGNAYVRDGISMARSSDNNNAFFIGKEDSSSQNLQIVNSSGSGKIIFRTNRNSTIVDHFVIQQGSTALYDNLTINGYAKANYYDVSTTRQASLSGSYTLGCGMYGSSIQHSVSDGYTLPALMWSAKSPNGNSSQFSIMSYHPSGATGYLIIGVAKNGTRTAFIEVQGDGVIQAGGDFLAAGGITMYSDQRKKTILNHVELSLKQIADAPLIEHYYNSDDKKTTHVGSIAQYWAKMNDWFCKLDSEGYYTMEIQNCALASAISIARELDRYETKTDKAIKMLKKRICELEEEVERLKSS